MIDVHINHKMCREASLSSLNQFTPTREENTHQNVLYKLKRCAIVWWYFFSPFFISNNRDCPPLSSQTANSDIDSWY